MPTRTEAETNAKAAAFDATIAAADRRTTALQRIARTGGPEAAEARRTLAEHNAAAQRAARADELAALPKSIAEAKGDVRAFAMADMKRAVAAQSDIKPPSASRSQMEALVRRMGMEPVR